MKFRLFTVLSILLLFNLATKACPIYLVGKIKIVDEFNNVIHNAKLWQYYGINDSFAVKKSKSYYYDDASRDTTFYRIYSGGYRVYNPNYKGPEKLYRISAEGFADVIIKDVFFDDINYKDSLYPTLIITLYGQKYIKKENSIWLLDNYFLKKPLVVTDTAQVTVKDYFSFAGANSQGTEGNYTAKISTYPNPVASELHIKLNYTAVEPVTATLSDAQGREVDAIQVESESAVMNLESYKPGNYYIVIKDAKGVYLHRQLIIKL